MARIKDIAIIRTDRMSEVAEHGPGHADGSPDREAATPASAAPTAPVAGTSGVKPLTNVDGYDIPTVAGLAYEWILEDAQRHPDEITGVEEGATWLRWRGSLSGVLRNLNLISADVVHQTRQDDAIRRGASAWLSRTGNAICVYRTNGISSSMPIWAVRSAFREHTPSPGTINRRALGRIPGEPDRSVLVATVPSAPRDVAPRDNDVLPCPSCHSEWKAVYLLRHHINAHNFDATTMLSDAIRQRRGSNVRAHELTDLLSRACGGGVVSTAYIGRVLGPLANDPASPVTATRVFRDYWYSWEPDAIVEPEPEPEPEPESALSPAAAVATAATVVAHLEPVMPSSNGSHAPSPDVAASRHLNAIATAFQRAEDAAQEMYAALDEAKLAMDDIVAENQELRRYQDRVKALLEPVVAPTLPAPLRELEAGS